MGLPRGKCLPGGLPCPETRQGSRLSASARHAVYRGFQKAGIPNIHESLTFSRRRAQVLELIAKIRDQQLFLRKINIPRKPTVRAIENAGVDCLLRRRAICMGSRERKADGGNDDGPPVGGSGWEAIFQKAKENQYEKGSGAHDKGQTLSLTLDENPSTGYRWAIEEYKPSVLELTDQIFKPGSSGAVGAPGKKIYGFLGKKIGESDLLIKLIRPWEDNAKPLKTFTLKIVVKEKVSSPE